MAKLFGEKMTKREVFARVGNLAQVAGVRDYTFEDGKMEGVRAVDVRTGGGLCYTVLPGRACDIAYAEFCGVPISFISKSGVTNSQYFSPARTPWGGSFYGGLVTTCGLTNVGVGELYGDRVMPTHGDIANIPAARVGSFEDWTGDEMKMGVRGVTRQASMYREELELTREISSVLGENEIVIRDRVENLGYETQPFMLLYHINFGYPMVSGDTKFVANVAKTVPAGDADPHDCDWYADYLEPGVNSDHHCVHHDLIPDADGKVSARLENRKIGIAVTISYDKAALKNLTHWKLLANGDYVTAIEPCNNYGLGTTKEEKNGTLEYLKPGEVREFEVHIAFEKI